MYVNVLDVFFIIMRNSIIKIRYMYIIIRKMEKLIVRKLYLGKLFFYSNFVNK